MAPKQRIYRKLFCVAFFILLYSEANGSGIARFTEYFNQIEDPKNLNKVIVDLDQRGSVISSLFYGSQFDSYSPPPPVNLVKELKLGIIRMGGNEYDVFNWQNNYSLSRSGLRKLLGYSAASKILREYQAQGLFQINMFGFQPEYENGQFILKNTFTPEAAGNLIKKLNGDLKLNIVHVSLGNEPEQWNETHSDAFIKIFGRVNAISADDYIHRFIQFVLAIRSAQEEITGDANSIKIWGPEFSASWLDWNTGNMAKDCQWSARVTGQVVCSYGNGKFHNFQAYFLDSIAKAEKDPTVNPRGYKLLDYFSFHYYGTLRNKISDVKSVIKDSSGKQWVSKMLEATRLFHDPTYINTVDKSSYMQIAPNIFNRMKAWRNNYYPNAKIGLTEFALDSDYRSIYYHPIVRPLYLADVIAIAATEGLDYFNNFVLSSAARAKIPWVMLDGIEKTNLFYTYSLFSNFFKGTTLHTEDNMGDIVNSYAVESDGMISLALINKSVENRTVQIYLKKETPWIVTSYVIPAWSISILKFSKNQSIQKKTYEVRRFGAKEMNITVYPSL
ncbi:MAG: glycoside hydrolase family 44 protein [Pseudobdellovibrionaceae bacterium]